MLEYEKTKEENSVEIYFCEPLSKKKPQKMNDELSDIFISFSISDEKNIDVDKARKMIWQFSALEKRMEFMSYKADNRVKVFIVMLDDGAIDKVIMYTYYMQYLCKKHNVKHITWEIFGTKFFPDGFFSDEDLHSVWDGQKISRRTNDGKINSGSDNLLDYGIASKSLIF